MIKHLRADRTDFYAIVSNRISDDAIRSAFTSMINEQPHSDNPEYYQPNPVTRIDTKAQFKLVCFVDEYGGTSVHFWDMFLPPPSAPMRVQFLRNEWVYSPVPEGRHILDNQNTDVDFIIQQYNPNPESDAINMVSKDGLSHLPPGISGTVQSFLGKSYKDFAHKEFGGARRKSKKSKKSKKVKTRTWKPFLN